MKIRHEHPTPDMDWKVQAPLVFETPSGAVVRIESWSLSGLVWPKEAPDCPKTGTLSVPFQGVDVRFPVRLATCDSSDLVQLEGLSGRQRETLALFYRSLLSGKMASSGEVITSLDTPVDLVPMEETEAEQSQHPAKHIPRPVRVVFNVAVYLLIATMVVGIIGNNIFTNLDRIDIQHGRVLAPLDATLPDKSGFVERVNVTAGQGVRAGDVLVYLRDPALVARLGQIEAELAVARDEYAQVAAAQGALAEQQQSDDIAMRMAVAARLHAAFVGGAGFDDMRRQWLAMRGRDAALASRVDPIAILSQVLAAEAARRAVRVETLSVSRQAQLDLIEKNHVRAPSDGVVRDIQIQPGQVFDDQTGRLAFERADPRVTIGWVSERFAETLFIGMPATIGFNENGQRVMLQGSVTDVRAGDHPERPGEFGIMVTVATTRLSAQETKARLRLGAPVNLEAKRQLGARLRNWIAGVLS